MTTASERREIIRVALEKIRKANSGVLRPRDVVKAARDPKHALHDEFDWNDETAAQRFREDTARTLIREYVSARVVVQHQVLVAPYYVRDTSLPAKEQGYTTLASLDRDRARETMLDEIGRCKSSIERARGVVAVIDKAHPRANFSAELELMLAKLVGMEEVLREAAE